MTQRAHTAGMNASPDRKPPLASFVLRVRGQPARLHFELLDLRTGERRRFASLAKLSTHLRALGLELGNLDVDTNDDR
jgi:hypothetical protein